MEAREEPRDPGDPGYDDWFDEPEPLSETHSGVNGGVYEDAEEVWMLREDDRLRSGGGREIVVGGRSLTLTQLAIVAVSILALFFGILAAFGVFNGGKTPTPTVAPPAKKPPPQTTTAVVTPPATEAPAQTLNPGDTGSQVKILQRALAKLGFDPGTPDGSYGPTTKIAVEKFQVAKGLAEDGVVGPATLNAIQKALAG
jgi:hypothetical protein